MPKYLCAEATNITMYLINKQSTKVLKDITRIEVWNGMKSILKYVRVFDCIFYVNISKVRKSKLDEKLKKKNQYLNM